MQKILVALLDIQIRSPYNLSAPFGRPSPWKVSMGTGPGCWRENRGFVVSPCRLSHQLLWRYQYLLSNRLPQMQAMLVHVHIFALAGVILHHHIFGVQKRLFPKHIPRQFGCFFLVKRLLIYRAHLTGTVMLQCGLLPVRTYRTHQFSPFFTRAFCISATL